jgi:Fic family protein
MELATAGLAEPEVEPVSSGPGGRGFLTGVGVLIGAARHLGDVDRTQLIVDEMSVEAMTTSEIEGEFLNRASVQSSILKQLGLATDNRRIAPAERGISELVVALYQSVSEPLSIETLFGWHRMVMSGRADIRDIGTFRTSVEPMRRSSFSSTRRSCSMGYVAQ